MIDPTTLALPDQIWWYVARSGGIVALVLVGLSVLWGLALSTRVMQGTPTPAWLLTVHRRLGGLAVSFTGIHVAGLVLDDYVHFGPSEILVPLASAWHPVAVAWGIVAAYLLVAIQASSLVMRRLPRPWWKAIHASSWFVLWTGLIHGATAGTDAAHPLYIATMSTIAILTVFLTGYRVVTHRGGARAAARMAGPAPARPAMAGELP